MLLQALYELAQQRNLVPDMGYSMEPTHYEMRISPEGKLLSLELKPQRMMVPQAMSRCSDIAPRFFVDNTKYVFGLGGETKDTKAKEAKRLVRMNECFEAYYAQIIKAAIISRDEAAVAYQKFGYRLNEWHRTGRSFANYPDLLPLSAQAPKKDSATLPDGWVGSEVIVCYLGDEATPMFQRPKIREQWSALQLSMEKGRRGRCLVTGKIAPVLSKHFPIKGLPGAQASGAFMCCYDKPAFSSRGAVQGENACISHEGAVGYVAALHWLLQRTEKRRHQYGIQVGNDTVMLVWSAAGSQFNPDTVLEAISPSPDNVLQYPASAWSGMAPEPIDHTHFYAVLLSPNASRVVVRDFIDMPVRDIKANILRYHEDLKIGEEPRPISLWLIQRALNVQLPKDRRKGGTMLPPLLASSWMQAIFKGTPYPSTLLDMALKRLSDPSVSGRIRETCCAVIKAVLLRMPGQRKEITVALDEKNTDMPYLLGRLFAVMERLQQIAIPGINTSMRDKHISAAFQSPSLVYPSLMALSSHHFRKVETRTPALARWLEKMKIQIVDQMPQKFPARLLPIEQGQWNIGYLQQVAALNKPKTPTTAGVNPPAPPATQTQVSP